MGAKGIFIVEAPVMFFDQSLTTHGMGSASARAIPIAITFRFLEFKYQSFCWDGILQPALLAKGIPFKYSRTEMSREMR